MFVVFLAATLCLVIIGGILTVQGFQATVKADYEKRDAEQEALVTERINTMLQNAEDTLNGIASNEVLVKSFFKGRKNSLEIYAALYDESQTVRDFAVVDLYVGGLCMYSTRSGYKSAMLPEYYSVLHDAASKSGKTVYALDPGKAEQDGAALLIARQIVIRTIPDLLS